MGRGFGDHVKIVTRAFDRISKINIMNGLNIQTKLNTVVTQHTLYEDWSDFIISNNIKRWKILKVMRIEGENNKIYDMLAITASQFTEFINRH